MGYSIVTHNKLVDLAAPQQCCFVSEDGHRCEATSTFWVGKTLFDYALACGDHAEDLRTQDCEVIRLADGFIVPRPKV